MTTITFKPGMEEQLTLFDDSPDAGDPECVCSLCGELIDEDELPLRIFVVNGEYRLHQACAGQVIEWQGEHDESVDLNDNVIDDVYDEPDDPAMFGPCCACEQEGTKENPVRNLMMIEKKAPVLGTGWGCVICKLPFDGASAVVCDRCLESEAEIRFAIKGYAMEQQRVPISELKDEHRHNMEVDHGY